MIFSFGLLILWCHSEILLLQLHLSEYRELSKPTAGGKNHNSRVSEKAIHKKQNIICPFVLL